ncbi:MAG: hypothetical protein IIU32_08575 [Firmicutes bacterium]|nr:hypothetical protein [Bacillota bacterium]
MRNFGLPCIRTRRREPAGGWDGCLRGRIRRSACVRTAGGMSRPAVRSFTL